jgi:hypothetical protein
MEKGKSLHGVYNELWGVILSFVPKSHANILRSTCKTFRDIIPKPSENITITDLIVDRAPLSILQFAYNNRYSFGKEEDCEAAWCEAAFRGDTELLQWLKDPDIPWWSSDVFLPILRWIYPAKCPEFRFTHWFAARGGHIPAIQWFLDNGYPLSRAMMGYIAKRGHLKTLQWAHDRGGRLDEYVCAEAAYGGHLDTLNWLLSNGCPGSEYACIEAARGGHLDILKQLRANECPWDESTWEIAKEKGNTEILEWLRDNGCPGSH